MNGAGEGEEEEETQQQQQQLWLLKTEPEEWSWQHQAEKAGLSVWDGVRNPQAQKFMKEMRIGDLCVFYHTGKDKEAVGTVEVVRTFYPDPTDYSGKWGAVDVREVEAFERPVTLAQMKGDEELKGFRMLRQPRLSVVPVEESIWSRLCELGGVKGNAGLAENISEGKKKAGSDRSEVSPGQAANGPNSSSRKRKKGGGGPEVVGGKAAGASRSPAKRGKKLESKGSSKRAGGAKSGARKKENIQGGKAVKSGLPESNKNENAAGLEKGPRKGERRSKRRAK